MLSKLKQYSWALDLLAYYYSKYENTQYSSKIKLKREFIHKAALENEKNPNITREYLTLEKNVSLVRKWKEKPRKNILKIRIFISTRIKLKPLKNGSPKKNVY